MTRGRTIAAALLLGVAVVAVRGLNLAADPPAWLSWSSGIYTDEGFYGSDARQMAISGHWSHGDFHGALVTPTLYWLQLAAFRVFGPGMESARLVSVLCGSLTVLLLFLTLRRLYGNQVAWTGAVLLGFSTPFVFYNRLALMETPAAAMLTGCVLCLACLSRKQEAPPSRRSFAADASGTATITVGSADILALCLSGALFGLALITKAVAAPAGVALALWTRAKVRRQSWIWILLGAAIPIALVAEYWTQPYTAHLSAMDRYYVGQQFAPHSVRALALNFERAFWSGRRDGLLPTLLRLEPILTVLASAGVVVACRKRTDGDMLFLGWLLPLCAVLACLSYTPSRYDVLFLPALASLAARAIGGWRPKYAAAVCAVFVVVNATVWANVTIHPAYTVRDGGRRVAKDLPTDAVVIGQTAPELCLTNRLTSAMVQPGLANDSRPVETLHATAIMVTRSGYWDSWWYRRYPALITPTNRIDTVRLGPNMLVDIYRVEADASEKRIVH